MRNSDMCPKCGACVSISDGGSQGTGQSDIGFALISFLLVFLTLGLVAVMIRYPHSAKMLTTLGPPVVLSVLVLRYFGRN